MFKDFSKEAKDLLTKNTAEGKAAKDQTTAYPAPMWKVESKLKPKAGACPIVVNPVGDAKSVSANIEFVVPQVAGLKGKFALQSAFMESKPTITFEQSGRKVEASVKSCAAPTDFEVTVEDKQSAYAAAIKVTKSAIESEVAVPVGSGFTVGASADFATAGGFKLSKYAAGVKYNCCKSNNFSLVSTGAAETIALSAAIECPMLVIEGKHANGAALIAFNRAKSSLSWTFGLAGQLPMCPLKSSWKAKIDNTFAVSLSHFVELCDWKVATTYDVKQQKAGIVFTRE